MKTYLVEAMQSHHFPHGPTSSALKNGREQHTNSSGETESSDAHYDAFLYFVHC